MHHSRKTLREYDKQNQNDKKLKGKCSFCDTVQKRERIDENKTMVLVRNRVPYEFFEARRTTGEHYLVVPKRHVVQLSEFSDAEKLDWFNLISKYEQNGFNVYARGVGSISRTQDHIHTHLIRLENKWPKFYVVRDKKVLFHKT